jgi:TRAP-type C4-dicarboxylate transport system permease small subunit
VIRLDALGRWLSRALAAAIAASGIALAATMTAQVVMRYGLRSSLLGFEELTTLFGLWLYFTGFAYVSLHDQHIRGGLLVSYMRPQAVAALRRLFSVLAALICLYFFALSLQYLAFLASVDRRSTYLRWPSLLWIASLNVGLLLASLSHAIRAVRPLGTTPP